MDDHYRRVELPIGIDQFYTLPRNAAYKYEYWDGRAVLTPRPKFFTCARDLSPVPVDEPYPIHPLPPDRVTALHDLFLASVRRTQPFESLGNDEATAAARAVFERTATGQDGPLIGPACFTATDRRPTREETVGAILVTLAPSHVLTKPFPGPWKDLPPADAVDRKLGVPHVTWVFVHPWEGRNGIGTALLAASVAALAGMGFTDVASTFALDNGPSAMWHWRNGFRLLPQVSALRREMAARS